VALRHGLDDTGFVEGKNLTIEYRWSETVFDRLRALAAELVSLPCSVIVGAGNGAALALKAATRTIPCPCRTWKVCDCHGDHRVRTALAHRVRIPNLRARWFGALLD
jgi:ABC-type uncharacterized transport system substrate-binding protein